MKKAKRIIFGISLLIIFCMGINIFTSYKPIVIGQHIDGQIVFIEKISESRINLLNIGNSYHEKMNVIIPVPMELGGVKIPLLKHFAVNNVSDVFWSIDGKSLGFLYATYYPNVSFPALFTQNGEIYSCYQDSELFTNYAYPIQVMDDEKIIINIGRYPDNYLAQYNMKNCELESIYYDGKGERTFAVSNNGWLAVNEEIDGDYMLNVYDENRELVYSENSIDYYYFLSWSKDGTELIFRVFKSNNDDKTYIYDFGNKSTTFLGENIYKASFSPDGKQIIMEKLSNQIVLFDSLTNEEIFVSKGSRPDWKP